MEPDLDEREPVATAEFDKLLKQEKRLAKWYEEQSESMQYAVCKWPGVVNNSDARQRRAEQMAERMLLTLEGEKVLPPVVEVAFRRVPAARRGWNLLTASQRRSGLFAVFCYQSPEAREKRVRKEAGGGLFEVGDPSGRQSALRGSRGIESLPVPSS